MFHNAYKIHWCCCSSPLILFQLTAYIYDVKLFKLFVHSPEKWNKNIFVLIKMCSAQLCKRLWCNFFVILLCNTGFMIFFNKKEKKNVCCNFCKMLCKLFCKFVCNSPPYFVQSVCAM